MTMPSGTASVRRAAGAGSRHEKIFARHSCCGKLRDLHDAINLESMKAVKLSDLIEAFEIDSDEFASYVDLQTGEIVQVDHALLSAVEEGDDDLDGELGNWEKSEVRIAQAIVSDPGERYVDVADKAALNELRQMERFVAGLKKPAAAKELSNALKGKGAIRSFKDAATRLGVLDQWYTFRDDAVRTCLLNWAKANDVRCEDDIGGGKP